MSDQERHGLYIPPFIFCNEDLSFTEKMFVAEVLHLQNTGECSEWNRHFATFSNLSYSRASKIIASLIKRGHLGAHYEMEGKRIIKRTLWVIEQEAV